MSYVGLSGGFGNLTLGRVGAAGAKTGGILDNSFHYGDSYTGFRTGNAISYAISTGGVSAQLDAIMNADHNSGSAIDEMQLGLSLSLGDVGKIAFSHVQIEDYTTTETVAASHTHADFETDTIVLREGMTTYNDYMLSPKTPTLNVTTGALETSNEPIAWQYGETGSEKDYKKGNVMVTATAFVTTADGTFATAAGDGVVKGNPMIVKVLKGSDTPGVNRAIGSADSGYTKLADGTFRHNSCNTAETENCDTPEYHYAVEYRGPVGSTVIDIERQADGTFKNLGPKMVSFTQTIGTDGVMVSGTAPGDESTGIKSVKPTMVIEKDDDYEMKDGDRELTVISGGAANEMSGSSDPDEHTGKKKNTVAAEFGLGGITAFVGYTQVESNMKDAKKDKITHYGIRGGLGDSGVNFLVQLRSENLQGSKPADADRDPYVVNLSKSLGDGASAYIEHGTQDAKGEKAKTRIGMIVNF